jgi:hypothetical protein
MALMLNKDATMIARMEQDLIQKVQDAYDTHLPDIDFIIHGVFSLDELEMLAEGDLNRGLTVGVGYLGAEINSPQATSTDRSASTRMINYSFIILLALPIQDSTASRCNVTELLTILRNAIFGSALCAGDRTQRTWNFVREKPEIAESSKTLLYYSQVWQAAMPTVGNQS